MILETTNSDFESERNYKVNLHGVNLNGERLVELLGLVNRLIPSTNRGTFLLRLETKNIEIELKNPNEFQRMLSDYPELQKPKTLRIAVYSNEVDNHRRCHNIYVYVGENITSLQIDSMDSEWVLLSSRELTAKLHEYRNFLYYAKVPALILTPISFAFLLGLFSVLMFGIFDLVIPFVAFGFMFGIVFDHFIILRIFKHNKMNLSDIKKYCVKRSY